MTAHRRAHLQITFVNHAGMLIESGEVRLLVDPWLRGDAFNRSWSLLSPTWFPDFSRVTHIWFSHEHPDHFHPPSVQEIPEDYRSRITVLYQSTRDKKILDYCRSLGFQVVELPDGDGYSLNPSFRVLCGKMATGDSWLLCDDGNHRLLNLNDCELKTEQLAWLLYRKVGSVDALFTQFSYAGWIGNIDEPLKRREASERKVKDIIMQANVFKPKYVVPFASYVWFSHEENYYMNDEMNKIHDILPILRNETGADIIIMYPGDSWKVGDRFDSSPALMRYRKDYEAISNKPKLQSSKMIPLTTLQREANIYVERMRSNNSFIGPFRVGKISIFLDDHKRSFEFSLEDGLKSADIVPQDCDIIITSDSLLFWFKHDWGGATIYISGRMQAPDVQRYRKVYEYFYIGNMNNRGDSYPLDDILRRIRRRVDLYAGSLFRWYYAQRSLRLFKM